MRFVVEYQSSMGSLLVIERRCDASNTRVCAGNAYVATTTVGWREAVPSPFAIYPLLWLPHPPAWSDEALEPPPPIPLSCRC